MNLSFKEKHPMPTKHTPSSVLENRLNAELDRFIQWTIELEGRAAASTLGNESKWFKGDLMAVYTRSTGNYRRQAGHRTLVLANIEVDEEHQRQGIFTRLLERIEQDSPMLLATKIAVECVNNPHLAQYLAREGFTPIEGEDDMAPTVVRDLPHARPRAEPEIAHKASAPGI